MAGGVHGMGACVVGWHAWWGACMAGGMHVGGDVAGGMHVGHVW